VNNPRDSIAFQIIIITDKEQRLVKELASDSREAANSGSEFWQRILAANSGSEF
jgi:hypothetical protein